MAGRKKASPKKKPELSKAELRKLAIEQVVKSVEKSYGAGTIIAPGSTLPQIDCISTGCLSLDYAMGGGFARGRISEVYGPAGGGKTSLALRLVRVAQDEEGLVVYLDLEHALHPGFVEQAGVAMKDMIISQPDNAEQALNILDMFVRSGGVDLIVVDSVAALVPEAELQGQSGDMIIGLQARLMSQALRKLVAITEKTKTHVLFINQNRATIGFGSGKTTAGGVALKYYATHRLDVARIKTTLRGDVPVGHKVKVKVVKNKISTPFLATELDLVYGEGISPMADVFNVGLGLKLIEQAGSWFNFEGEALGQGALKSIEALRERPELVKKITETFRETYQ